MHFDSLKMLPYNLKIPDVSTIEWGWHSCNKIIDKEMYILDTSFFYGSLMLILRDEGRDN